MSVIPPKSVLDALALDALKKGQTIRCRVTSGSMRPTFDAGDILTVQAGIPRVGDIALIRLNDDWVSHRVVDIISETFYLRGDANQTGRITEAVAADDILGVVKYWERDAFARRRRTILTLWQLVPKPVRKALKKLFPTQRDYVRDRCIRVDRSKSDGITTL